MPNIKGGSGYKKAGKKRKSKNPNVPVPDTVDDFHALVLGKLGGTQFEVLLLSSQQTVHALIPGKFRRKVWINKGDYVHVKKFDNVYEIYQKLEREDEKENARLLHSQHGGGEDFFSKDTKDDIDMTNSVSDEESDNEPVKKDYDDMMPPIEESESETETETESDEEQKTNTENRVSTRNLPKSSKFDESKLRNKNISVDKLRQKLVAKERDVARRTNVQDAEKPSSIVEKKDSSESEEVDIDDI